MICPLHRQLQPIDTPDQCPRCRELGLYVRTCEIDKINRVLDGLVGEGSPPGDYDPRRSYAVLVFTAPSSPSSDPT